MIEAVHDLPGRPLPGAQAGALARALGECLGADAVTIALWLPLPIAFDTETHVPAGRDTGGAASGHGVHEYHWSSTGPDPASTGDPAAAKDAAQVRLRDGEQVLADISVRPAVAAERLRRWPELHTVARLLLSDLQAQLAADDDGRLLDRSAALLADARLRAAGEMEQQRHQLERDLHDGAQHHMVALQMSLAMVEHRLAAGEAVGAAHHLDRLRQLLAGTEEVLHTTATGLLSLPLADHGLVTALAARLSNLETVALDIDPLLTSRRYPPEVEAAVYLACLEAVSNANRHAPGAAVTLTLRTSARGLGFEVADTGPGFDTGGQMPLRKLAARLASVGGTLRVRSSPTAGTRVTGFVSI